MNTGLCIRLGELLRQSRRKLVTAESCTGGLISHWITNISGSSDYFLGGVTSYAYEAKEKLLGVKKETLAVHGAVSRETVLEMAYGIRCVLAGETPVDDLIGVSVSGIAGPGGEMPGKPVGLVWIGLSAREGDYAWMYQWNGNRLENKEYSAQAALDRVIELLENRLPVDVNGVEK